MPEKLDKTPESFAIIDLTRPAVLDFRRRLERKWLSGRAPPCQGGGREFKSRLPLHFCASYLAAARIPRLATFAYLFHHSYVTARTDIDTPIPYRQNKHVLFGQQEGVCKGCRTEFPIRIFEVDHIIPQSRGGSDHIETLQLLCPSCNRIKGGRPMEYLAAQLAR